MMRKPPAGFRSILGPHGDHERPKLRAIVAEYLARRSPDLGTDEGSLARRQRETFLAAQTAKSQKPLAAMTIHVEQRAADIAAGG